MRRATLTEGQREAEDAPIAVVAEMKVEALAEYKRLTTANLLIETDNKTRQINWSSGIWYK